MPKPWREYAEHDITPEQDEAIVEALVPWVLWLLDQDGE